jgi:hypothetical protein
MRCKAGVIAKGMACGLIVGQPWDSCIVLKGMSLHCRVLSRHFMKALSLHAIAIGRLVFSFSRDIERFEVQL